MIGKPYDPKKGFWDPDGEPEPEPPLEPKPPKPPRGIPRWLRESKAMAEEDWNVAYLRARQWLSDEALRARYLESIMD